MSLLPKHTQKLTDDRFLKIGWYLAGKKEKEIDSYEVLREILDPAQNPLTFEEVKAWFDVKVSRDRYPFNIHILAGQENAYRIIVEPISNKIPKAYFFLKENGFTQSSMDCASIIPYEPCAIFNLLPEGLVSTPLDLFCQMKGYVNI